ncbi:CFEM domain protein [Colletotrichum truncatum]|uniref:CFEM domain protein n=1 Tax=Colletotrichum truncatum TaxID=5467 RepID=A0ACC3YU85_COLTU|nr:CFEM domain protein [Colletotrichum truncatum]KAF6798630.1 CFEM domain protein [Colletotrichum truncatum]
MVEPRHYLTKRERAPKIPYDFNTIKTCTWWYDNHEGFSCKEIRDCRFGISPEDSTRRNPSVTPDCGNWQELSYGIRPDGEQNIAHCPYLTLRQRRPYCRRNSYDQQAGPARIDLSGLLRR